MHNPTTPIRILIVDDHPVVRQGLRSLLSNHADLFIVGEADHARVVPDLVRHTMPDVVLLDIRLPGMNGIELAKLLHQEFPQIHLIVLTNYDDDVYLIGAMEAGAQAYLLKSVSDDTLVMTIHAVQRGERLISPEMLSRVLDQFAQLRQNQVQQEIGLTDLDIQILRRLADGVSNDEIGRELGWSTASIKRKVQHIFDQLGVTTRPQAAAEAVRRHLI